MAELPEAQRLLGEKRKLAGLQAELPSIAEKLRSALQERLEHPLMGQRAEAIQQFFEAAPRAREEAPALLGAPGAPARPTAVEALVTSRRAAALTPVLGLTGLIGAKLGGIEDVISRGTQAFQSLVNAQQERVGLAQTAYDLALQQLVRQAEEEQQRFANEWAVKQITGGTITLPTGETIRIPSEAERAAAKRAPREPDKYPYNEATMGVGVAGLEITPERTEKLRRYQEYLLELETKLALPKPDITAMEEAGYTFNPATGQWEPAPEKEPGILRRAWQWLVGK